MDNRINQLAKTTDGREEKIWMHIFCCPLPNMYHSAFAAPSPKPAKHRKCLMRTMPVVSMPEHDLVVHEGTTTHPLRRKLRFDER